MQFTMLNNISYRFISEQQMQMVQYRAHQLFLQLKEEQKWEQYCQKHNVHNIHGENTKKQAEEWQHHCKEIGVQVEISHQTNKVLSAQQNTNVTKVVPRVPITSKTARNIQAVHGISEDLKIINEKLNGLQSGLHELQKNPVSVDRGRFAEDSYSDSILNPLNREQFLHNSLKSSLMYTAEKKEKACSEQNRKENLPSGEKKKTIAFQLPYVLKEERELARRRMCGWSQSKTFLANKRTLPKKPFSPPVCSKPVPKLPRERSSLLKKTLINKTKQTQVADDIDVLVDEVVDDLLKETLPTIERIQRLKEQHIKKNVEALVKKISEIENAEKLIQEKWQPQKPANMSSTYSIRPTTSQILKPKLSDAQRSNKSISLASREEVINNTTVRRISENSNLQHEKSSATNQDPAKLNDFGKRNVLPVSSDMLRNIFEYKRQFAQYLGQTVPKQIGGLTPWISVSQIADSILDDCLQDIGTELQNIPQAIIVDIYNNEFVLSV